MAVKNTQWAMISALEITESILLKRGLPSHYWWRFLPIVCEAIQELGFTSMPLVRHTLITKNSNETWFKIPDGYTDWVSVGIRQGNKWIPVGVSERLMPYPNSQCEGGEFGNEYSADQYKRKGAWKSWLNSECKWNNADFFGDDFLSDDFSETQTVTTQPQTSDPYSTYGWGYGYLFPYTNGYAFNTNDIGQPVQGRFSQFIRPDEVTFNVQQGTIMVPDLFPSDVLYLTYVGFGSADTLTYIPVNGQAVIEAYAEWKYAQNTPRKSGSLTEARYFKAQYDEAHRLYRARNNNLTETVIRRIVDRGYVQNSWDNGAGAGCSNNNPTQVIYYTNQSITVVSGSGGVTYVQNSQIAGKNIVYVIVGSTYKTSGYYVQGDMLIFTDGTEFYEATTVVIYYEN